MDEAKQPGLKIAQIYLSSVQFKHREDALSFPPNTKVELSISVSVSTAEGAEGKAGLIKIGVRTVGDDAPLYHFDMEMVGLIEADTDDPNLRLRDYLGVQGPVLLYPFLREAVANVTGRGRFGPVWLRPFNFGAIATPQQAEEANAGKE